MPEVVMLPRGVAVAGRTSVLLVVVARDSADMGSAKSVVLQAGADEHHDQGGNRGSKPRGAESVGERANHVEVSVFQGLGERCARQVRGPRSARPERWLIVRGS